MSKRGKTCKTCAHRERPAIDLALSRGVSPNAVARRYKLGPDSVYRHARNHLPPQLRAKLIVGPDLDIDLDKLRSNESQSLLSHLVALRQRLFAALDLCEEHGDTFGLARISSQLHTNLETTGKLLGDLGVGSTTVNNVLVMPAYVELRVGLVNALAPFPEAKQAVAQVLHALEAKAADAIKADTRELAS
jgi:hypothetical protein